MIAMHVWRTAYGVVDDAFYCVRALTYPRFRVRGSVSTVQLGLASLTRCRYLHAGGVAVASFLSLVEPHTTDESAFCGSMGSATVSRLGGLALPHLDLTDLFVSL